jgi:hypothetical protein
MKQSTRFSFIKQSWNSFIQELPLPGRKRYWKENHWYWNMDKTILAGRYRTPYGAPKGRMVRHKDGTFSFYIYNPPEKLWTHPTKKSCFQPTRNKGEYEINFTAPKKSLTIDGCIIEVERTLVEAFEHRR